MKAKDAICTGDEVIVPTPIFIGAGANEDAAGNKTEVGIQNLLSIIMA